MSLDSIRDTLANLSSINPEDQKLQDTDKLKIESKILHFINQNEREFTHSDVGDLDNLRKRAVVLGGNRSRTVQKIDQIIGVVQQRRAEGLKKEISKKYAEMTQNLSFYDPSQLRYEADALWENRTKGAYALLDQEGVLAPVVYGLYQAAAKLAQEQLGNEAAKELRDKGLDILAQIDPRPLPRFTTDSFKRFLNDYVKENDPLKKAQGRVIIEKLTPSFAFEWEDEKLLKAVQEKLETSGVPSQALEDTLKLLRRQRSTLLALLPSETQEIIVANLTNPQDLLNFIKQNESLKEVSSIQAAALLDSGFETMDPETASRLANLAETRARKLNLSEYDTLSDKQLLRLLKICPNVEELDLSGCRSLTPQSLKEIATLLPQLRILNLTGCPHVNDACLEGFKKLESLSLHGCDQFTDCGLFALQQCKLKVIALTDCPRITADGLLSLSKITTLTSLSIANCQGITDQAMTSIAQFPNLTTLSLLNLHNISPDGVLQLHNMNQLHSLALIHCGGVDFLEELLIVGMNGFNNLQLLNISWNSLSNAEHLQVLYRLPALRHLIVQDVGPKVGPLRGLVSTAIGAACAIAIPLWVQSQLQKPTDYGFDPLDPTKLYALAMGVAIAPLAIVLNDLTESFNIPPTNNPNLTIHK